MIATFVCMRFTDVVGQQAAKDGLLKMWHDNHFPHAILLSGREGTGGLPMALAMAQYIFCDNKQEFDSCGTCAGCSKAGKLEHADLHLAFPAIPPKPGTKAMSRHFMADFREFVKQTPYATTYDWLQYINAENKQGNLTAEECREIIDQLNLKSYEGGEKVQIIWRPEYLGKEGNILLKLIEEPPADTYLIFVAEGTEDILQTILSRTQMIRLAPIAEQDIADALIRRSKLDETHALQIAHIANGSYIGALKMVRHTGSDLFPAVRDWFNVLFTANGIGVSKFADEWSKSGREQQKNFLHYVIQLIEQTIRTHYMQGKPPALPAEEAAFVQKLAAMQVPLETFNSMVKQLADTIYYIERNAHSKTQLHTLSLRLIYLIRNQPIPAI